MSVLNHLRIAGAATHGEELSFFGASLDEADAEMRQWLMQTIPIGPCVVYIQTSYATDGTQHHIYLRYHAEQRVEDRIVPHGLLGEDHGIKDHE